ncbi:MAG TPA: hypothetical protein VGC04_11280 [Cellulomonas sp.]
MAFALPVLAEEGAGAAGAASAASGAEGAGAASAASGSSGARAAGTRRAPTSGATSARKARTAPAAPSKPVTPTKTAAARADELVAGRTTRTSARRTLRAEYGATGEQADDLLDAATARAGTSSDAGEGHEAPSPAPASPASGSSLGSTIGRHVGGGVGALNSAGSLLLGAALYVVGVVYVRDGWPGVRAWLSAKFLNKVDGAYVAGAIPRPSTNGSTR